MILTHTTKYDHTRRLKLLKPVLNSTQYQFILWVTNQKWREKYEFEYNQDKTVRMHLSYKLWKYDIHRI